MKDNNLYDLLEIEQVSVLEEDETRDQKLFTRLLIILMVLFNILSLFVFYSIMMSSPGLGRSMAIGFIIPPFLTIWLIVLAAFLLIKRKQFQLRKHWLLVLLSTPIVLLYLIMSVL